MTKIGFCLAAALALLQASPALAHPHVLVNAKVEIVFDDAARIASVRHVWQFDDAFSAYAMQGLDANNDGALTRAELTPLARTNVESLAEYEFFTWLDIDGQAQRLLPPDEYWLDVYDGRLTLFYTLPLATPVPINDSLILRVFDPEFYVAIGYAEDEPVALINAPTQCRATYQPPPALDPQAAAALAVIPAEQRALPANLAGTVADLANSFIVICAAAPGGNVATAQADAPPTTNIGGGPLGIGAPEPGGAAWAGPLAPVFTQIAVWQSEFYRSLTDALSALKERGAAFWLLALVSFLYGIFHAAGPGHGKAVITAYLLASGQAVRRGVVIAFAAAFVQAATAILLVSIAAGLLNVTAVTMTEATNVLEIGSFALIAAVGAWLLWTRIRGTGHAHSHAPALQAVGARRGSGLLRADSGDDRDHDHDDSHFHGPDPRTLRGPLSLASAWSAIIAVGIRPCSGAIIVLVFALSQGLYLAGVGATLIMALGTGLTVAALASLAVVARDAVLRLSTQRAGAVAFVGRAVEIVGAAAVLLFGLLLLGAALSY